MSASSLLPAHGAPRIAPVIVTTVVIGGGLVGWLLSGSLFLVVGIAMGPIGRWAEGNRPLVGVGVQG